MNHTSILLTIFGSLVIIKFISREMDGKIDRIEKIIDNVDSRIENKSIWTFLKKKDKNKVSDIEKIK
jgi:hypothetical protein